MHATRLSRVVGGLSAGSVSLAPSDLARDPPRDAPPHKKKKKGRAGGTPRQKKPRIFRAGVCCATATRTRQRLKMAQAEDLADIMGLHVEDEPADAPADADARADGEEAGTKETINQEPNITIGFVAKETATAMLKQPAKCAANTICVIRKGVDDGDLPEYWKEATIMRTGKNAVVNGIVTVSLPKMMTAEEATFVGAAKGLIRVMLEIDAGSMENVHNIDATISPIEYIHNMWRIAPEISARYEPNAQQFDPTEYKDRAFVAYPGTPEQSVDSFIAYRRTDAGKTVVLNTLLPTRTTGAGGVVTSKMFIKLSDGRKTLAQPVYLEARIPIYVSGPEEEQMASSLNPCVDAIRRHVGAAAMEAPNARRSCYYRGFKVMTRVDMRKATEVKQHIKALVTKSTSGTTFTLAGAVEAYEVQYYASETKMATALNSESKAGSGGGKGGADGLLSVVQAMQASQADLTEQIGELTKAATSTAKSAHTVNVEISRATRQQTEMHKSVLEMRRDNEKMQRENSLQFSNVLKLLQGAIPVVGGPIPQANVPAAAAAADIEEMDEEEAAEEEPAAEEAAVAARPPLGAVDPNGEAGMEVGGRPKRGAEGAPGDNDAPEVVDGSDDDGTLDWYDTPGTDGTLPLVTTASPIPRTAAALTPTPDRLLARAGEHVSASAFTRARRHGAASATKGGVRAAGSDRSGPRGGTGGDTRGPGSGRVPGASTPGALTLRRAQPRVARAIQHFERNAIGLNWGAARQSIVGGRNAAPRVQVASSVAAQAAPGSTDASTEDFGGLGCESHSPFLTRLAIGAPRRDGATGGRTRLAASGGSIARVDTHAVGRHAEREGLGASRGCAATTIGSHVRLQVEGDRGHVEGPTTIGVGGEASVERAIDARRVGVCSVSNGLELRQRERAASADAGGVGGRAAGGTNGTILRGTRPASRTADPSQLQGGTVRFAPDIAMEGAYRLAAHGLVRATLGAGGVSANPPRCASESAGIGTQPAAQACGVGLSIAPGGGDGAIRPPVLRTTASTEVIGISLEAHRRGDQQGAGGGQAGVGVADRAGAARSAGARTLRGRGAAPQGDPDPVPARFGVPPGGGGSRR